MDLDLPHKVEDGVKDLLKEVTGVLVLGLLQGL